MPEMHACSRAREMARNRFEVLRARSTVERFARTFTAIRSATLVSRGGVLAPPNESTLSSRRHEVLRCALTRGF